MIALRASRIEPMHPCAVPTSRPRRRALVVALGGFAATAAAPTPISLTGWWSNPTPNNAYLLTGRTEYTVSEQGGTTADGNWPDFGDARYVHTNGGSYGYGCASLRAIVDGKRVVRIVSAASLPLARCRSSAALKKAEPAVK